VTDYRRFLGTVTQEVLPYVGGPFVEAVDRRLRLVVRPHEPGYWRFEVRGRDARPLAPTDPPDLSDLPAVRGFAVAGYLVGSGGVAHRLALGPPDEPPLFAPLVARRWPSGALLFDLPDFAGVEDEVRAAYDRRRPISDVAGVPAALRAAYAYALLLRTATELRIPMRPGEARHHVTELAEGGEAAARRLILAAEARRAAEARGVPTDHRPPWMAAGDAARADPDRRRAEERAAAALHSAHAVLHGLRWLADGLLEVRYDHSGEQFVSVVDGRTLRIVDAGLCLDGQDDALTLESLPGVISEAIRTGQLHITGW
jgi:hypothetical protein